MSDVDRHIADLSATQHALISDRQADALGLTPKMRQTRVRAGRLVRVEPGVLRIAGTPVTYEATLMAAVLAAGPGAVVSHRSAAVLWQLDGFRPGRPEITIPRGAWYRPADAIVHESTDLDRAVHRRRGGLPITSPSRTLLDVALRSSDARLLTAMESARRRSLTSWRELVATLQAHARRGRPGVARMRRVIVTNIDRDEVTDSAFESLVLSLLRENGLPDPVLHHRVLRHDGHLVAVVDLAYPGLMLAVELDGSVHLQRDVWERDRPRQNQLELLGWTVLRFSWRTLVEHPEVIVREIADALRRARAA
jgi:very-short-patch-repair endonuclease